MRFPAFFFLIVFANSLYADDGLPELEIENIAENVYLHRSYQRVEDFGLVESNGLVAVDNGKAFIIDTPWSATDTEKLAHWVEKQGYELSGSISTHWHADRTAGIAWLNAHEIPTYATKLTNELLQKDAKESAVNTINTPEWLVPGLVEAFYPGGGHTIDNIVVWLPRSEMLFGGCLVRSLKTNSLGYTGEAIIEQWPDSIEKLLSRYPKAKIVIPGHGGVGDASLLKHTKKLAEAAADSAMQPARNVSSP